MKELQNIIKANDQSYYLRIYLSSICDQKRNSNSGTKEMEVLLLGYIASIFKTNLLDPMDKPPNFIKSVVRVCEGIHAYFKVFFSYIS